MRRAAALVLALPLLAGANDASLTVNVSAIRNTQGTLIACLWRTQPGFPTCQKSPGAVKQTLRISGSAMTVRFGGLAPGAYVVTVQHDEDGNGRLKTNFIGIPREGVGISNNPGGIPRWSRALVQVGGQGTIAVTMRYL